MDLLVQHAKHAQARESGGMLRQEIFLKIDAQKAKFGNVSVTKRYKIKRPAILMTLQKCITT